MNAGTTPCHPRESGDPVNDASNARHERVDLAMHLVLSINGSGYWVPAFAGMTVGEGT